MKVLVTGGAGFIGSNFIHYWQEKYPQDELVVLDKLTYAGHKESLKDINNLKFIAGDICDPLAVSRAMEGVDLVVHFAAETHVDRSIVGSGNFIQTNIIGTHILLEAALKNQVKLFHHVSTDEVFGELPLDRPELKFNENTPFDPHSPYSTSKAASDMLVKTWFRTYGLPITISNTSNNYGPYQDPEKFIPRFITNLLEDQKVPLMGKGENIRDWCYVSDHCQAIDLIVHSVLDGGKGVGETFCVGGNSERTNLQVAKSILAILGKDESYIEYVPHRLGHDSRYAIDNSKLEKFFGWNPSHKFEDWLVKTVDWYKQNSWWWKPLKDNRPDIDPEYQQSLSHHGQ
jgi:dTDP-glucose 4,6-dehydratase